MLRIKTDLDSARSGVLYHFTNSIDNVESIIENGLRTSSKFEQHMREIKANPSGKLKNRISRQLAENPESAFVSLARSPSIITELGKLYNGWKFGVIFSADKLSDIAKIIPYHYSTSNRKFSLTVYDIPDDPGGMVFETEVSPEVEVSSNSTSGDAPLNKFIKAFKDLQTDISRSADSDNPIPIKAIGGGGTWLISGELTSNYSFKDLPVTIQNMLRSAGFESEDRLLLPGKGEEEYIPATKKAIIGIIVPDASYWNPRIKEVRDNYPDIPMYVYRRDNAPSPDKPVPRSAYRLPTA